jgi:integrative and conjugative element protein (TIGR02256 family)
MSIQVELNNRVIVLTDSVIASLQHFRQIEKRSNESGGIILGQIAGREVFLTRISIPNQFDSASRFSFDRNPKVAQVIIDFEHFNSQGKTNYLGEWHTHPESNASPSQRDRLMIKSQWDSNKLNQDFILSIILGLKKSFIGLYTGKKWHEIQFEL